MINLISRIQARIKYEFIVRQKMRCDVCHKKCTIRKLRSPIEISAHLCPPCFVLWEDSRYLILWLRTKLDFSFADEGTAVESIIDWMKWNRRHNV